MEPRCVPLLAAPTWQTYEHLLCTCFLFFVPCKPMEVRK